LCEKVPYIFCGGDDVIFLPRKRGLLSLKLKDARAKRAFSREIERSLHSEYNSNYIMHHCCGWQDDMSMEPLIIFYELTHTIFL